MRVLVTGGAGFIGSHIVDYHLSRGDDVIAIDDLSSGQLENIITWINDVHFRFIQMDILQSKDLREIVANVDRIYNMGAIVGMQKVLENPLLTLNVNIGILEKILNAAAQLEKKPIIIVASSSEVYGRQLGALSESQPLSLETTLKGHANYPVSKMCNEVMALSYYKEYGVPVIAARIFNTIGPRQFGHYGMVVPRFVKAAVKNEPITVYGDGSHTRAFCDARDLVNILAKLAESPRALGQVINVGKDESTSMDGLAKLVKEIAKSESSIQYIPIKEAYNSNYIEIPHRKPDLSLLCSLIDVDYEWSLTQTIANLVELEILGKSYTS
jgi:UDP-glucose 4-epimerase